MVVVVVTGDGGGGGVQRRGDEGVPETDVPSSRFFHEKVTRRSC